MTTTCWHQHIPRLYQLWPIPKNQKWESTTVSFCWPRRNRRNLRYVFRGNIVAGHRDGSNNLRGEGHFQKIKDVLGKPTARACFVNHLWCVLRVQSLRTDLCSAASSPKELYQDVRSNDTSGTVGSLICFISSRTYNHGHWRSRGQNQLLHYL